MDKLISAEHFIKSIQLLLSKSSLGEISSQTELTVGEILTLIENEPAAFDKEKVIGELKQNMGDIHFTEDGSFNGKFIEDFEFIRAKTAIEIVEKGGVD